MGQAETNQDLAFIKQTMELATRYTNLPVGGYLTAGILGLAGAGGSYWLLGMDKAANLHSVTNKETWLLGMIWLGVLLLAFLGGVVTSRRLARDEGLAPWNSLAARLFLSQIPQVLVAGLLTIFFARNHLLHLIPALWLLHFGLITFSFSYFTGKEHRVQSICFLGLGTLALCGPGSLALPLLALGFGGIHLACGTIRWSRGGSS